MSALASSALSRLEKLVGSAHFRTHPAELAPYQVDGVRPVGLAQPGSAEEVAEVVRFAAAEGIALIPAGSRTKLGIGAPPSRYDVAVDMTRLNRIPMYEPGDLTLSVEAGTRLADLERVLRENRQFLPLAVPFADKATIGGVLAANSDTPLRQFYGTARDYVLGMEFVTGEGTASKSGGHVVKNVTGYDLHKLMIGALGTLGIMTQVHFKTFPVPPTEATFIASFPDWAAVFRYRAAIARSPLQPRLLEAIEPGAARMVEPAGVSEPRKLIEGQWSVVVGAAGNEQVVRRHGVELERMAGEAGATRFTELSDNTELLACIREFPQRVLESWPAGTIFRMSVVPTAMGALLERAQEIMARNQIPSAALVRASGVVYLALLVSELDPLTLGRLARAASELIEASSSAEIGGRPMIEWCPVELKRAVSVWGPHREDWILMKRLKQVFDPNHVLSPGRFAGDA